jgi:hypothetical protein
MGKIIFQKKDLLILVLNKKMNTTTGSKTSNLYSNNINKLLNNLLFKNEQ